MNPYPSFLPTYAGGYNDGNGPSKQPARKTIRSLLTDFQTNPLPLPVWLWNCLVIYISISVAWFLIRIGVIILAGLAFFLAGIFG